MNVLMFGWEFPPYISGGLGTACQWLTRGLTARGVDVTFVLPRVRGPIGETHVRILAGDQVPALPHEEARAISELTERLRVLEIDAALTPYLNADTYRQWVGSQGEARSFAANDAEAEVGRPGLIEIGGDYGRDLIGEVARYATVGWRLGKTESFDLVHAHDWMTYPAAIEAARASGKPLVAHVHATEFDRSGEQVNQAVYDIERAGMQAADRVIAVSDRTRAIIIDRYGVEPGKVVTVHNAIDKDMAVERAALTRSLPDKIVLFLGRVTMQKGPEFFVDAAQLVLQEVPDVRFVLAGTGDLLPWIIERAATLRITDRFHFTGFLKGADVDRMFAMSDVYVLPSVSEPFGLTVFEALKHDVPVILSRQAGVGELLPNARKVDFWDIRQLADAIVEALTQGADAVERQEQNRRDFESVSWDRAAEQVEAVYRAVTGR